MIMIQKQAQTIINQIAVLCDAVLFFLSKIRLPVEDVFCFHELFVTYCNQIVNL